MAKIATNTPRYIYCVIEVTASEMPLTFDAKPIGAGEKIYLECYKDLAVVMSDSTIKRYTVGRENAIAHQKVIERVLMEYPLLPVRFGTVTESDVISKLLIPRYKEFKTELKKIADKNEMGLKIFWCDMPKVYQQIVEDNPEIKKLRNKLNKMSELSNRNERIELGIKVETAVDAKREEDQIRVMKILQKLATETVEGDLYGETMVLNASFLVEKKRQATFDAGVNAVQELLGENYLLKYVGPIPPYDFVEIRIDI
ncbi:MAG: GvpL/GvpF family gas vesicle protein [Negativicutes bacterium]